MEETVEAVELMEGAMLLVSDRFVFVRNPAEYSPWFMPLMLAVAEWEIKDNQVYIVLKPILDVMW